ncbi:MAG: exopolysaccharide biosynthesis protein, partial [Hyphomicrobiales bacterium]
GQIALGREKLWLPRWLTEREMPAKHGQKLLSFLRPISKVVDNVTKPRARFLTGKPMRRIGAAACVLVGLIMPILEVIPFTSTWAGVIVATYGLAITVRDGVLAMAWVGLVLTIIAVASLLIF